MKKRRELKVLQLITVLALGIAFALVGAQRAEADSVAISIFDFSGSETVIDFNSIANDEGITSQFSGLGVTFSAFDPDTKD